MGLPSSRAARAPALAAEAGEFLEVMPTWNAVHSITPMRHLSLLMLEAHSVVKRGRRCFSPLLLFDIPLGLCVVHVSYSATQSSLFKAILKASVVTWPLHSRQGSWGEESKLGMAAWGAFGDRGDSQHGQQRPRKHGDGPAMGAL